MDHKLICKEIESGKIEPIYFLHGEEPYFIDSITDVLEKTVLEEPERDFNQITLYGRDVELLSLLSELKGFPMMGSRKLVILREAQDFSKIEDLCSYVENINPTTVFIINYKYKTYDSRKKLIKAAAKNGLVYKSDKLKDYQLVKWIHDYVKSLGYGITPKAEQLLAEFLGNDLGKIVNEIEKLSILIEKGTTINDVHIEENIGISKDYNTFELSNALSTKNAEKAFRIVQYFSHNPKAWSLMEVIPLLFKLYAQLMRIHFLPNKSREAVATALKVHPYVAGELVTTSRGLAPKKLAANISILQEYDLKSKGIGSTGNTTQSELLKELVFRLLN